MPEDLPTPNKSLKELDKEELKSLKSKKNIWILLKLLKST